MPTVTTLSGGVVTVDLGTRDFEAIRSDILDPGGLADLYTPNWTDRSELDLGVALVEGFSFMYDNLSYYQDRNANEAFLSTAVQRKSVIKHGRSVGYELDPATSAEVDLTFVTSGAGTVPSKTRIEVDTSDGSNPATFELENDFVSPGAGTYTGNNAIQGITVSDSPVSSTGAPGFSFELERSPLSLNSSGSFGIEIWVTEGGPAVLWTRVTNFLESEATDTHYVLTIDEFDVGTITFGDGVKGKKPASGIDNIQATYRVGGGTAGNQIGPDKLTKLVGSFPFVVSVTNPDVPAGGEEKESIDEAKENIPDSLVSMGRAVTHADYTYHARTQPGVSKAYAYREENNPLAERIVIAVSGSNPVPSGTWDPYTATGTGLIGAVGDAIELVKTTPTIVVIEPCRVVDIHLSLTVYGFDNVRRSYLEKAIRDSLLSSEELDELGEPVTKGILDIEYSEFGLQVPVSLVMKTIENISGVDYLDILRFQRVPYGRKLSEASLSDILIGSFAYGINTPADTWIVEFISITVFTVTGVSSGLQVAQGTLDAQYTIDDGSFSFMISSGLISPLVNEKWEIRSGAYVGNIDPDTPELCRAYNNTYDLTLIGGVG